MKLKITLVKSLIARPKNQLDNIAALGLTKMHHSVVKEDSPALRGQIFKVKHLVSVEELPE